MTDRPTPAERAADLEHDPARCHICMNPNRHGEQAPDPEELAHAREVDALRERLEDYRREVERRDEYLRGADAEIADLRLAVEMGNAAVAVERKDNFDMLRRLESAEGTLNRHGFRRCDLPACNCGWWHAPEFASTANHFSRVVTERNAALAQVATLTAERDGAVAEAAALRRERDVARAELDSLALSHANCDDARDEAINAEREACARAALDERSPYVGTDNGARDQACEDIAAAIRARSKS